MTKKRRELDPNNPSDMEELRRLAKKAAEGLFNAENTQDFDERGILSGGADVADKSDAELVPEDLEEYTPEERQRLIKECLNKNAPNKTNK